MGPLGCLLLALLAAAAPPQLEEDYAECMDGYEWDPETEHCKDVDECRGRPPPCPGSLRCLNHFGGFLCLPPGAALITGAPPPALAPPLLAPPPPLAPPLALAPPLGGRCPPGYGPAPDGSCQDIDECRGPPPCRPSQDCVNLPGGFECRCPPGYRNVRTECVDEDECRQRWCQHSCANSPGSFSCRCHPGFRLAPNNRSCLDVDECSMGARCAQRCLNTFGSFRCRCRPGFALSPDGLGCHDVDECGLGLAGCQHGCHNHAGGFGCSCPPGYRLRGGRRCQDVDECSEGTHGCSGAERCFNTFGGHRCDPPQPCHPPYVPVPGRPGTCRCPEGAPPCSVLPPRLILGSVALPRAPPVPTALFQLRLPPGPPRTLRLRGGPPGAFRIRELSNQSALLELRQALEGPQELGLEVELLQGAWPRRGPAPRPGPAPSAPPRPLRPPRPLALLRLAVIVGEYPF